MKLKISALVTLIVLLSLEGCFFNKGPDYFPLKVGNKWEYKADITGALNQTMEVKVSNVEEVSGVKTAVVEYNLGGQLLQTEYYQKKKDEVVAHKRAYAQGEILLEPPVTILRLPLKVGEKWSWQGKNGGSLSFEVVSQEKITVPAGEFDAIKIHMTGSDPSGLSVQSDRWFAEDVGMVKEDSLIPLGGTSLQVLAELKEYEVK